MALPAVDKTFQYNVNQTLASTGTSLGDAQQFLDAFKATLIGFATAGYTVAGSGDGVAGAMDTVDRLPNAAAWVRASADGSAHSWLALNHPAGGQVLISFLSGTPGRAIKLAFSPSGAYAGGSDLLDPTAGDEQVVLTGASGHTWGGGGTANTTSRSYVLNVRHSEDGEVTIAELFHSNNCSAIVYIGRPDQPISGWTDPLVVAWYAGDDDPPDDLSWVHVYDTLTGEVTVPRCFASALPVSGTAEMHLVSPSVSVSNSSTSRNPVGDTGGSHVASLNEISGEHEFPRVGLYCGAAGDRGPHGRLFDVRWAGDELGNGNNVDGGGSRAWASAGPFLLPWDGVSVPLTA